jgi:NCAIR mutase (PurE)-related protein
VSDFVLDWEREARTGVAEAVLCEPKTPAQIAAILETAATNGARLLLTRLAPAQHEDLPEALRRQLDFDALSRTAILGGPHSGPLVEGTLIVAAGTADLCAAHEAARTLAFHGHAAPVIALPTSVGYGVAAGGAAALNTALSSCAPGVKVMNIDNGFGAAAAAIKILGIARR